MLTDLEAQEENRYSYVPAENPFMRAALERVAVMHRAYPEVNHPTCSVIVKDGEIVAVETGRQVHRTFCPRIALGSPSGKDYDYCPDNCHHDNHSEANAIRLARTKGISLEDADIYLGGHWWACGPCLEKIEKAGIARVYLADDAKAKYNDAARRADAEHARAGVMRVPLTAYLSGFPQAVEEFSVWLGRVGITPISRDAGETTRHDVSVLLPGAAHTAAGAATTFDFRGETDLRHALTRLSRELPDPPPSQ